MGQITSRFRSLWMDDDRPSAHYTQRDLHVPPDLPPDRHHIRRDLPPDLPPDRHHIRHDLPPDLQVSGVQHGSKSITIKWIRSSHWLPRDTLITVTDDTTQARSQWQVKNAENPHEFEIPASTLLLGHSYMVNVTDHTVSRSRDRLGTKSANLKFSAVFCSSELRLLLQKAEHFVQSRGRNRFWSCKVLYRNKMPHYYTDIMQNHGGIMKGFIKDNNGDPGSPTNGKLKGLFFAANLDNTTGQPPSISNFGTRRLSIPAIHMLETTPNVYFTDFYCINKAHYVTLVLTRPGSQADIFCAEKLLAVDLSNNPFFRVDFESESISVTRNIWVELFYTEDIDLKAVTRHGASFTTTLTRGVAKPNGLPKNQNCGICNL